MKTSIAVKDRREADAIRTGLEDPSVRAFVICVGVLKALPTQRARRRVLEFVIDKLDEEQELPFEGKQPSLGEITKEAAK
jgi:hypothetical protein